MSANKLFYCSDILVATDEGRALNGQIIGKSVERLERRKLCMQAGSLPTASYQPVLRCWTSVRTGSKI